MSTTLTTTTSSPTLTHISQSPPSPPQGDVHATLHFYHPPPDNSLPYNLADLNQRNYGSSPHQVLIRDARPVAESFTLDHDAFQILFNQPPASSEPSNWTDDESIQKHYYPEVESLLLKTVPGANKVIIFDHTIRRSGQVPEGVRTPVPRVHIDQTGPATIQRIYRHASSTEEAKQLLKGRYRIINVWRPLTPYPVESWPLAFASSHSVSEEDIVPVEHRYTKTGYIGQTAAVRYNAGQQWWYLSGMRDTERVLLECFDSWGEKEGSGVKGGRCAHTAFEDRRMGEGARERWSVEVRALVFGP